jgi:hypothetical protein
MHFDEGSTSERNGWLLERAVSNHAGEMRGQQLPAFLVDPPRK